MVTDPGVRPDCGSCKSEVECGDDILKGQVGAAVEVGWILKLSQVIDQLISCSCSVHDRVGHRVQRGTN